VRGKLPSPQVEKLAVVSSAPGTQRKEPSSELIIIQTAERSKEVNSRSGWKVSRVDEKVSKNIDVLK
jgi:uncharacterized Ntn-hydrolase superfamily protein